MMAKDKEKLPFNEILCTPASQATKIVNLGPPKVTPTVSSSVYDGKAISKPFATLTSEKGKGKLVVDSKSLFEKLAFARAKARKTKELTLVACLVGKFLEFPKIFTKLRMDWRFIKGDVQFHDQKNGWFEIVFSNPLDLAKTWENRPYHVGGQLLLIKPWSLDFDPLSEPISVLDLWIRIFKLPNEYKSADALSAILEANGFGKFIRLDPIHLKRKWVKFVRICVNTDVEITTGQKIIIPDENMVEHKYNVWFDDFPVGCGNCGEIDHVFNMCPDKTPIPPSITITLKKPSSKGVILDDIEGWTKVGNEKGNSSNAVSNPHGHRPYLAENAGIDVVYESEDSGDQEISLLNVASAIIANDPSDDTRGNVGLTSVYGPGKEDGKVTVVKNKIQMFSSAETEDEGLPIDVTTLIPPLDVDVLKSDLLNYSPEKINPLLVSPKFIFEEAELENNIPLFEDEEDPSEVEEEDPEELIFAGDLEGYLNEPDEEMMVTNESANSFHSTRNSMLSASSMVDKMDGLAMYVGHDSKSNSSKRKTIEGDEDTASSQLKEAKKPRI